MFCRVVIGEPVHLGAVERAIGDGHAQHIGVQLQVEPVHQAQGLELVLGQAAVNTPCDLIAELRVAGGDEVGVKIGIGVHYACSCLPWA